MLNVTLIKDVVKFTEPEGCIDIMNIYQVYTMNSNYQENNFFNYKLKYLSNFNWMAKQINDQIPVCEYKLNKFFEGNSHFINYAKEIIEKDSNDFFYEIKIGNKTFAEYGEDGSQIVNIGWDILDDYPNLKNNTEYLDDFGEHQGCFDMAAYHINNAANIFYSTVDNFETKLNKLTQIRNASNFALEQSYYCKARYNKFFTYNSSFVDYAKINFEPIEKEFFISFNTGNNTFYDYMLGAYDVMLTGLDTINNYLTEIYEA